MSAVFRVTPKEDRYVPCNSTPHPSVALFLAGGGVGRGVGVSPGAVVVAVEQNKHAAQFLRPHLFTFICLVNGPLLLLAHHGRQAGAGVGVVVGFEQYEHAAHFQFLHLLTFLCSVNEPPLTHHGWHVCVPLACILREIVWVLEASTSAS